ncbi:MAG: hypothetical protein ACOC53_04775 [Candidatus Saliniplasma sp.]
MDYCAYTMEDAEQVMKKFLEDYEENPDGWRFWTDRSGEFYDIYIIREDTGYFLKIDSVYTQNPIGKGTKIDIDDVKIEKDLPSFGYRHFTKDELENFMYILEEYKDDKEKAQRVIKKKMEEKPTRLSSIDKDGALMMGPINKGYPFNQKDTRYQEINKELKKKLLKKFRNEKPMYR